MSVEAAKETRGFEAEVRQLLDLMVHSLYSNKDIFLRELVSNASDAADKLRFEALSDGDLYEGEGDLVIEVIPDKDARTVTVRDNGIGMSFDEVVDNLGTIAKSGTREFFRALTGDQAKDARLIGQFGVGFYSSFIVADRVTVTTRRAGLGAETGVRWESSGEGEYTIEHLEVPGRGTEVTLHLREGEDELLDGYRLRGILRRYSDHITVPVMMPIEGGDAGDEDAGDEDAGDEDAGGEEVGRLEQVNSGKALWSRAAAEIQDEEYDTFYRHVAHDFEAPLARAHNRVEGNLEYTSLLFVPARAPFDLLDRNVRRGVHLYVRRVFIMDDAEQLMPPYLRFVRGVIDSADLPLNVSREILQQSKQIDSIRAGCVKRVLNLVDNLVENEPEKFTTFWREFGRVFKEGIIDDPKNRERVAKLLRFASTANDDAAQVVSLEEYVARMKPGQEPIYFVTADNWATARHSPHLEAFLAKGVEVLLLTDEIDEWVVHHLTEFDGKPLQSVAKGTVSLEGIEGADDEQAPKSDPGAHQALVEALKSCLGERVKDVRVSERLTTSPACVVADEHEMGAHLERVLRAAGQELDGAKPILEINPDHLVLHRFESERSEQRRRDLAEILLDQAVLSEGGRLGDPAAFVRRVNDLIVAVADPGAEPQVEPSGAAVEPEAG
jgi:molecular chaperone HtpG